MLQNTDAQPLSVRQIAAHLRTRPWNVTNELTQGTKGAPGRLRGEKITGPGSRGAGGQWRVDRDTYLDWLGVPAEDRTVLGADSLPVLHHEDDVAAELGISRGELYLMLLRRAVPHVIVGWRRYLTHHQLQRLRVVLAEDCRDRSR